MTRMQSPAKCIGRAECQYCAIRENTLLASVDTDRQGDLLNQIMRYEYPQKTAIYYAGLPATDIFVVRKGMVKLEETMDDGTARIVRLINKGEAAGMETFLDHAQRYDQTAITLRKTEVCRIPWRVLDGIMNESNEFYHNIMEQWHRQLTDSERVLVEFSTGNLRQRLARVMLMLAEEAGRENLLEIHSLPIEDIAALTGVTKESVSRILAEFKRGKLLLKSSPHKLRFDEAGLREMAHAGN